MTGKPLPNVYDDKMKDADLSGTHGDDADHGDLTGGKLNNCSVRMVIDGSQMVDFPDDLITSNGKVTTWWTSLRNDVAAALAVLCRGDATSISVNRTLRDGVNNRRKLVVRFTATLTEVYDSEETDDFQ